MSKPVAIVSVINDLVTDQRVSRTCDVLTQHGYEVVLVGRKLKKSLPLSVRPYKTHRLHLFFEKGPAFYFFFHIRLWNFLRKNNFDLLVSNDLDTLWPNFYYSKRRRCPLIYDSHEIFCEVPELMNAPFKKRIWVGIERRIVPKLKFCITVNQSIAEYFKKLYAKDFLVVRNVPLLKRLHAEKPDVEGFEYPVDKKIIILQGSGININRGAEEAVEAMNYMDGAILLVIGSGDAIPMLKKKAVDLIRKKRVFFLDRMPPEKLRNFTGFADLGLSLDKDTNLNYHFSLPNKLFDYVHAGIPVLASPLPEVKAFIEKYQVGLCIESFEPIHIAEKMREILFFPNYSLWKQNTIHASAENNWQLESKVWLELLEKIRRD